MQVGATTPADPGCLAFHRSFDVPLLMWEFDHFLEYGIVARIGRRLPDEDATAIKSEFEGIAELLAGQPRVFTHRDYHSRNLMVTSPNPGILDFQDAVYGPITYDLVSLFKDAYIRWDEERVLDWLIRYWEQARKLGLPVSADFSDFYRDFEWMGVQRHLKVLGIFARLNYRDGKSVYLGNMPLVEDYLRKACERYKELGPLLTLLDEWEVRKPQEPKVGYTF